MIGWTLLQWPAAIGSSSTLAIRLIAVGIGLVGVLTSAEQLRTRDRFDEDGLLSWSVTELFVQTGGLLAPLMRRVVQYPYFRGILLGRLLVAGALAILAAIGHVSVVLLVVLFFTDIAIGYRHVGGLTGTFQVSVVTVPALIVATAAPMGSLSEAIALLFIATQISLSYFVAGVSKVVSREWRRGTALVGVFSTEAYGHDWIYGLFQRIPALQSPAAWTVIVFECTFPVALVANDWILIGVLAVAVSFHLFTMVFMGLNNFLIGFPATYPAIIYANYFIRDVSL